MRQWLTQLPDLFRQGGDLIYSGRNVLRRFEADGEALVVKRFKRLDVLKGIIYTFFRKSKAERSYRNAERLLERGIDTPLPIAYIEQRRLGLVADTFYACAYTDYEEVRSRFNLTADFDHDLAAAFAEFVARLHESGVLHYDLNSGNVLYRQQPDGTYRFQLIDINRMDFMTDGKADGEAVRKPVPKADCMENLTLFTGNMALHAFVSRHYAEARGWDADAFEKEARAVKLRHDRRWRIRKMITHPKKAIKRLKQC